MKQLLSYFSPPPARGAPWVCKLFRRCLFLLKTTHGHQVAQQPSVEKKVGRHVGKCKVARVLVRIKLTKATSFEAVEQAKAPIALPVRTDRAIFGVPVATYLHRGNALRKTCKNASDALHNSLSCPSRLEFRETETHLRLGVDRLFDIGHSRTKGREGK